MGMKEETGNRVSMFDSSEEAAIAAIDLNAIKAVLPADQFNAISKLITCIAAVHSLNNPGQIKQ
jgi:hypothetical protein